MFMRHKWLAVSWARCVLRDMRWRFTLSYRDVEDLLAERALDVMSRNLVAFFVRQCDKRQNVYDTLVRRLRNLRVRVQPPSSVSRLACGPSAPSSSE